VRARVLLTLLATGCATMRNTHATSDLLGCSEEQVAEVARQQPEQPLAAEATPELTWYQGCGSTVVCTADSTCFVSRWPPPAPNEPPRVVDGKDLRPRRESHLPGLTYAETARREYLVQQVGKAGVARGSGGSNCGAGFNLGGIGGGGAGVLVALPVLVGMAAILAAACAVDSAAHTQGDGEGERGNLRAELIAIEARIHPEHESGCTAEEFAQVYELTLQERSVGSICKHQNVPAPEPEPAPAPLPQCQTGPACLALAQEEKDPDRMRDLLVLACTLGETTACERGASLAAAEGSSRLAAMMRQHREALLNHREGEPMPRAPWLPKEP
jgi:hypothetical protein